MDDQTQVPPFYPVAVIQDGTVAAFAGQANDYWFATYADANHVKADDTTRVGDTYLDGSFTRPAPLPAEGTKP